MLKSLLTIAVVWLVLGSAGAFMTDHQQPGAFATDVALGPISLGRKLLS